MNRSPQLPRRAVGALVAGCSALLLATGAIAHPHVWVGTKSIFVFENGALTGLRFTWLFDEMYSASAVEGLDKNNDGKLDAAELEELTKVNIDGLKEFDYFTAATATGQAVKFEAPKNYSMELLDVEEGPGPQLVAGLSSQPAPSAQPEATPPTKGFWSRIGGWFSGLFGKSKSTTGSASTAGQTQPPVTPDKVKVLALHMTLPLNAPIPAEKLTASSKGFQFVLNDAQMYIWFEPMPTDGITISAGAPAGCRHTVLEPEQDEEQKKLAEAFGRAGSMSVSMPGKAVMLTCADK
jgi:ABC-type uncharacterized transport system substrate-binding protein